MRRDGRDKSFDAAFIGMINLDVTVEGFREDMPRAKLTNVRGIRVNVGGDAANCAVTFAGLGMRCALCGRVGRDSGASLIESELAAAGVDVSFLARCTFGGSGTVVNLEQGGEASHLYSAGVNLGLCDADVSDALLSGSRIVCLNSIFGCGEIGGRTLGRAKAAGAVTAADTTTPQGGVGYGDIEPILKKLDWFLPSIDEACSITGEHSPERCADVFHGSGVKNVVIKLGAEGCFCSTVELSGRVAGFEAPRAVDLTGCGDSFVAAFLSGLAEGLSHYECALRANAAGAITACRVGSSGAVNRAALEEFLKSRSI